MKHNRHWLAAPILGACMACSAAYAETIVKVSNYADSAHPNNIATEAMAKRVADRTNGEVQMQIFPANALGSSVELFDQVRRGIVAMTFVSPATAADYYKPLSLIEVPYAFDSYEHVWSFYDGAGRQWLEDGLQQAGVQLIAPFEWGFREMTNKGAPIESPADLVGKKMRVPPERIPTLFAEALGEQPQAVNFNELYLALATGTVDGQDNPLATIYSSKFYEVQDNIAITNHRYTGSLLVASPTFWNDKLTDEQRTIILEEAKAASEAARKDVFEKANWYIEEFKKAGMTVTEPAVEPFRELMGPVYDAVIEDVGKEPFDAFQALVEEARAGVTEAK